MRPPAASESRTFWSSQEFIEVRLQDLVDRGTRPAVRDRCCREALSVSTVVMVVGMLNTRAALARPTTLFFSGLAVYRLHAERHLRLLVDEDDLVVLRVRTFQGTCWSWQVFFVEQSLARWAGRSACLQAVWPASAAWRDGSCFASPHTSCIGIGMLGRDRRPENPSKRIPSFPFLA